MTSRRAETAIIGGGLHGLACALELARRGQDVVVLERSWIGRRASSATAAGVRALWRDPAEIKLSLAAVEKWHDISSLVGDDCGFHAGGQFKIAENEAEFAQLSDRVALLQALGHTHEELIDATELRRLVPHLGSHCVGALHTPRDGAADPHRTIAAFRQAAASAGADLREQQVVRAIERDGGRWSVTTETDNWSVDTIVNAAGAWGAQVCAMVGEPIDFGYKASMVFVTERVKPTFASVVSIVQGGLSFKQSAQGTLVVGGGLQGTADFEAGVTHVDFPALARGALAAQRLFPAIATVQIVRAWTGLEGKTRDLLPVIGRSVRAPNVYHMFGFSGHGFALVPIVGDVIADLILHGASPHDLRGLGIDRLAL